MNKTNDNELSYVEQITITLIVWNIIEGKNYLKFSKLPIKREQKNIKVVKIDGKIMIVLCLSFMNYNAIFEKCLSLQKEIIYEIKWLINLDIKEINIFVDK